MNINIICIGKLKEAYWRDACSEYVKRLGAYCNVSIVELKETRLAGEGTKAELAVIEAEGREILSRIDGAGAKSAGAKSSATSGKNLGAGGKSAGAKSSATSGKNLGAGDSSVVALDVKGKKLSSEGLAEKLDSLAVDGKSNISFIIGGSLGLSDAVLASADYRLSFSDMTFPHQMMRVILLEQIYRAFKINRGETYHK